MYNPEQNDNYNEWIELYNPSNQSINLSGWSISDNKYEDLIEGDFENGNGTTILPAKSYGIIADHGTRIYENFSIPNETIKLYVDDSSIGNGLGNSQDKIRLKNDTGVEIDSLEWGYNYEDVPGMPADLVDTGHSLARNTGVDTDNTVNDFYEEVNPSPGRINTLERDSKLNISFYPLYVPKIQKNSDYSLPFAIKIKLENYEPSEIYKLKSYVIGDINSKSPATQTWDEESWIYSDRYTSNIITDENGNWSDWVYIRFDKNYVEYQNNIKYNYSAYLKIKLKNKENKTDEISKIVYLLDMDNSTKNGTPGGCVVGKIQNSKIFLENKIIIVENKSGTISGIYKIEDNGIDEGFISKAGYFKITAPTGSNYSVNIIDNEKRLNTFYENITIEQGSFGVNIDSVENYYLVRKHETLNIPILLENTGDFYDEYNVSVGYISDGWYAELEQNRISLCQKQKYEINLHIEPCQRNRCKNGRITISAASQKDIGETDEITIQFEILAPDLTITKAKNYSEEGKQTNVISEGEIVQIKAFLKNIGNENATNVDVKFYYDCIDDAHFLGEKHYDFVHKYQKYPSIKWDTTDVNFGYHNVFAIADFEDQINELDEQNNEIIAIIKILDTKPSKESRKILITDVYYHAHSNINNEYITIHNPTNTNINISNWYITNTPHRTRYDQTKIVFPNNTIIEPFSYLSVTQNASDYYWESGKNPDFEYSSDSIYDVPQMHALKTFTMSNKGEIISLKDEYNHTIDIVAYGETEFNNKGWEGQSISNVADGVILKRNKENNKFIDTNTSNDWLNSRRYGIGQSDFPYENITFNGEINTFVSPDNSYQTIINELRNANESIFLNIYEFTNSFLCDELVAALRRNVSVNLFLEGSPIGGISDEEKYVLNRIASNGGNIRFIVSDVENRVYARYMFNHGKYLVIDNTTVIVESCNWAKTGIPINPTYGNREWGVIIRNSDAAKYFLSVFLDDWDSKRCDSYSYYDLNLSVNPSFFMENSVYRGFYEPNFESVTFRSNFSVIPVFSPDTSYRAIYDMIDSAEESIYIQQLYIYKNWTNGINPFVEKLVNKSHDGIDIKVVLNYNPYYDDSNNKNNLTKQFFEENNIEVKFVYTNWSYFTNVHNKGMIVDNISVLISSINWNENSVVCNREAGVIIHGKDVAEYYAKVFFYDWNLTEYNSSDSEVNSSTVAMSFDYENTIYIIVIFTLTFGLIAQDWRKRKWV